MVKQVRKGFMLSTILVMLSVMLAACGGNNSNNAANSSSKSADSGPTLVDGKYDPPVTITTFAKVEGAETFKNGESAEDNVHTRWAKETLGIEIKTLWSVTDTNSAYATKLKLAVSSNEQLPDIVFASGSEAQMLIDSGKFADAGELFDKYASDSWKAAINESPSAWNEFTREGKRYGIPALEYDYNGDPVLWVREDWMKKLNLSEPTNLMEYEKMLDAFTNGDPDGDGKPNTFGIATSAKDGFNNSFALNWVFGAYGSMPEIWIPQEDGTLSYGSVAPEIKEGLQKLKDWVQKGYVPKEAILWDPSKAGSFMSAGGAGTFTGAYWSEAWPMGDLGSNNPNAKLATFKLPVGEDGKSMHFSQQAYTGGMFINKDMKNPEIFFTYINYLYDNIADPQPGSAFENGWAQGYDWDIVDGEVTYDLTKIPGGGVRVFFYGLLPQGPRIPSQNVEALVNIAASGEAKSPYEKIWGGLVPPIELESATNVWNSKEFSVKNAFTGGTTPTMSTKWDYLKKLELETFSKIIFGNDSVDAFDAFVKEWNSQGGEQITKEVNDWYNGVSK